MREEDIKINEAYAKMYQKSQNRQLNEGLTDVIKARGSQALGGIQSMGQKLGGHYNVAKGALKSGIAQAGATYRGKDAAKSPYFQSGQNASIEGRKSLLNAKYTAKEAKYNTYINSILGTMLKDLKRLGIPVQDEQQLKADIFKAFKTQMTEVDPRTGMFEPGVKGKLSLNQPAAPTNNPPAVSETSPEDTEDTENIDKVEDTGDAQPDNFAASFSSPAAQTTKSAPAVKKPRPKPLKRPTPKSSAKKRTPVKVGAKKSVK